MSEVLNQVSQTRTAGRTEIIPPAAHFLERYRAIRSFSELLCESLEPEDCVIQSMPDVSPTRWHLAHTTWFFETFVLAASLNRESLSKHDSSKHDSLSNHEVFRPEFAYLFNSYYNTVGQQYPRPRRGLLSRPTLKEIRRYREYVDERMQDLLIRSDPEKIGDLLPIIELGINHEQQHQELILTDIKHVFSCNPTYPVYRRALPTPSQVDSPIRWIKFDEGLQWIGSDKNNSDKNNFAFDNESPRHRVFVSAFDISSRLVTCGEFAAFIEDGGYRRPILWLSEGWDQVQENGWFAPLYWHREDGGWRLFTLSGLRAVEPNEPVCHVSYFEADAYARWAGACLPTEAAWETVAADVPITGNFAEQQQFHPCGVADAVPPELPLQMFGDVWEWTCSAYSAYPGYRPPAGALGEYNGKFMCNQLVLRGGSCATSVDHVRTTYRNFFPPDARWQFTGIRLAKDQS